MSQDTQRRRWSRGWWVDPYSIGCMSSGSIFLKIRSCLIPAAVPKVLNPAAGLPGACVDFLRYFNVMDSRDTVQIHDLERKVNAKGSYLILINTLVKTLQPGAHRKQVQRRPSIASISQVTSPTPRSAASSAPGYMVYGLLSALARQDNYKGVA